MKYFTFVTDRFINCTFCSHLKLSMTLLIRCARQDTKSVQPSIRPSYHKTCIKSVIITTTLLQPFYGSPDIVWDYPSKPVPER